MSMHVRSGGIPFVFSAVQKLLAVLVAVCVGLTLAAVPAQAYEPRTGARFNDPTGNRAERNFGMAHIRESVNSALPGSIVRIASYSFSRGDIANALINACERGVIVQVVLNNNWTSPATLKLRDHLNKRQNFCNPPNPKEVADPENPDDPEVPVPAVVPNSYVKICRQACRINTNGNQHMKFFLFSQVATASNVVMVGSTNPTDYAADVHWNDIFTVRGSKAMFDDYSQVFQELVDDKQVADPYRVRRHGDFVTEFGPRQAARNNKSLDPVLQRLNQVSCKATRGTGVNGRTALRVMMYAWVGNRGLYLARKVANLRRSGCNVSVILSQPSKGVKQALRAGRVKMRTADFDLDNNRKTGFNGTPWELFTHEKWMSVNGNWQGRPQRTVWTGSENWSDRSFNNDEVTIKIPRAGAHSAYNRHFNYLWKRWSRPL
jgi:phosphatidylserine/phosphatidylglycerophosphate/cardiolipin synthase-like enzyme